jgi:hypothetical protein
MTLMQLITIKYFNRLTALTCMYCMSNTLPNNAYNRVGGGWKEFGSSVEKVDIKLI